MPDAEAKRRKTSKVDKLPLKIRTNIQDLIKDGKEYKDIVAYLGELGYTLSIDQISRYWTAVRQTAHLEEFLDKAFQRFTDDAIYSRVSMDEAITRMVLRMLFDAIVTAEEVDFEGKMTLDQAALILRSMQRIKAVDIQMNSWRDKVDERASKAALDVEKAGGQHGLPPAVVDSLKREILGISNIDSSHDDGYEDYEDVS